jgi:dTDP-4-amino-4,6-dideoxygalactose transaminase
LCEVYDSHFKRLGLSLQRPKIPSGTTYNYAYYPVVFNEERQLTSVRDSLNANYIYPRRYFYPSLHHLPYIDKQYKLEVSESVSKRVLCLPLYHDLPDEIVKRICNIIADILKY